MSAPTPDSGRWVTPPPIDDGSAVWSSEQYVTSTELPQVGHGPYGYSAPAHPDYGGYARGANSGYAATYPYYANYGGTGAGATSSLPPYWPQRPGEKQPIDGYAITSLVFGILGGFIFAIGFGIAALRRIARGSRRGRPLALAGIGLAALWMLVLALAAVVLFVNHDDASRNASGVITHRGELSPVDLRVDDCVSLPTSLTALHSVTALPCAQLHNGQVYTILKSPDSIFPGTAVMQTEGLAACEVALPGYLGTRATTLNVVALVPSAQSWPGGDRAEICIAVDRNQDITGDIRPHA
jgi:hypothetical protein